MLSSIAAAGAIAVMSVAGPAAPAAHTSVEPVKSESTASFLPVNAEGPFWSRAMCENARARDARATTPCRSLPVYGIMRWYYLVIKPAAAPMAAASLGTDVIPVPWPNPWPVSGKLVGPFPSQSSCETVRAQVRWIPTTPCTQLIGGPTPKPVPYPFPTKPGWYFKVK